MSRIIATLAVSLTTFSLLTSGVAHADTESEKAVKELLVVMKYKEMMTESMKQMLKNMPEVMLQASQSVINGNAKLSPEQKKAAMVKAQAASQSATTMMEGILTDPKLFEELEKEIIPLYAKYLNAEEVRQVVAFYKTPVGNKLLTTFPQIMGESSMIAQKVVMPRVEKHIEKFASEYAK